MMKKNVLRAAIALAILIVVTEVCLRIFFGLGSPPLVYANTQFGYAFQPNQSCKRFGHRISYNEAGLRSEGLRPLTGMAYRILCVGGSVTNGGAPIDQGDTYPYQLEQVLGGKGGSAQVLNASAVGWGLANEEGFLQDKGIFEARTVVLEVGTRDLYQESALNSIVGTDPSLPDHKPSTAIGEVVERYLLPRVRRRLGDSSSMPPVWSVDSMTEENYNRGLGTLKAMVSLVSRLGAKSVLLVTPDKEESLKGTYRADHRKDLSDLASSTNGLLIEMMPVWRTKLSEGRELFRNDFQPNPEGNQLMAEAVAAVIEH
jgi:hypothetical protein